jgi:hypothetical protein
MTKPSRSRSQGRDALVGVSLNPVDSAREAQNPAIPSGLHEAGAYKYESEEKNRQNLKRTKARERRSATQKDRNEHGSERESTRSQLYEQAKRRNIPGRSKMKKQELERALH